MGVCDESLENECGTQDRCSMCECSKVDARVCLSCKHKFCHSCVEESIAPDCPTLTSCPICCGDAERQIKASCPTRRQPDTCGERMHCYQPERSNDFHCYNCIKEKGPDCRVLGKLFCLECDVPMCESHLQQHKNFVRKKPHTLMSVTQYNLTKRKFESRRCKIHPKQALSYVCEKCEYIVCQVCVTCCDCKQGGKHEARELDIVALEMASRISQEIKNMDCVRLSGEQAIAKAHQALKKKDCELESVKRDICGKFQEKVAELNTLRDCMLREVCELSKKNLNHTMSHKQTIQCIVETAVKSGKKAKKLLCYCHNVDIATEAVETLKELECIKVKGFPTLQLEGYVLKCERTETSKPCLCPGGNILICHESVIPETPVEDACDGCNRCRNPCAPLTPGSNPQVRMGSSLCPEICPNDDIPSPCEQEPLPISCTSYSVSQPSAKAPCGSRANKGDIFSTGRFHKFEFKVKDVHTLSLSPYVSSPFVYNKTTWTLIARVQRDPKNLCDTRDHLGVFLKCTDESECYSQPMAFKLKLHHQGSERELDLCKQTLHNFVPGSEAWGHHDFAVWSDVEFSPTGRYVSEDGTIYIKAHLCLND